MQERGSGWWEAARGPPDRAHSNDAKVCRDDSRARESMSTMHLRASADVWLLSSSSLDLSTCRMRCRPDAYLRARPRLWIVPHAMMD